MANYVNFARRMRLPALYFQLGDHIPTSATMASYQTSIISLGVQPSTNGREPDDFHLLAMTQELSIDLPLSNRVANQISNIIRKKSDEKTILSLRFVPSLQSAVCSLQYALCTDRFVSRTVLFRECPLARRVDLYLYVIKLFKIRILSKRSYGPSLELSTV